MKRSELRDKLAKMVEKHKVCCNNYTLAELILDEVRDAGMLPPAYLQTVKNPLVPGDIPMENGKFGLPVNEWEKE